MKDSKEKGGKKMLPLPVKKNKNGQRVAEISVTEYYGQIMEEVLEAHVESVITEYSTEKDDNEAEELVDVITTCVTRLDILGYFDIEELIGKTAEMPKDFYRSLARKVLIAHSWAVQRKYLENESEKNKLVEIIEMCIARLEFLGYKRKAREKIYAAVNEKNRKRGYFEEN